jgi:cytoskeleton protein RodZ
MKLSVNDVARQLKLQPRQVEALARDDYTIFSSPVFVRGFLRNYARFVGLDGDTLVLSAEKAGRLPESALSPSHQGGETAVAPPKPGIREPLERDKGSKSWIPVTVGLIAVAGIIVYFSDQTATVPRPPAPPAPVTESVSPATVAQLVPAADPAAAPATEATAVPAPPAAETIAVPADAAAATTPVVPNAAPSEATRKTVEKPADKPTEKPAAEEAVSTPSLESADVAAAKPAKRSTSPVAGSESHAGDPEIRLSFTGESWVEVRDARGGIVFSDLSRPGVERVVHGQPPFQVTVGRASGVSMTYNSRSIDLAPYTQAEVARLTLQ